MAPMTPPEFGPAPLAIVTGGGRRIGAELARALSADGWSVLIHHGESAADAEALASEIGAETVGADLASPDVAERIFDAASGRARLLVNNASAFAYDSLESFTVAGFDHHMAVNLRAPALLSQRFATALPSESRGLVINLLDAKLDSLNPDYFTYTLAKAGLAALTELSARALSPRIRVNGIAPSVTLVSGRQTRANFTRVHSMNALRRGVEVGDIVAAMRYLVASPAVTAETLTVDGGFRLMGFPRDVAFLDGTFSNEP